MTENIPLSNELKNVLRDHSGIESWDEEDHFFIRCECDWVSPSVDTGIDPRIVHAEHISDKLQEKFIFCRQGFGEELLNSIWRGMCAVMGITYKSLKSIEETEKGKK